MQKTAKLGLNKPDLTDYVNISDLNENMDVLDEAVGNAEDDLTTHLADDATNAHLPKNVGLGNVDNVKQIPMSQKGTPNGVATLDENGYLNDDLFKLTVTPSTNVQFKGGIKNPTVVADSKLSEIRLDIDGLINVSFFMNKSFVSPSLIGEIFLNGISVAFFSQSAANTWTSYTKELLVKKGDVLALFGRSNHATVVGQYRDFSLQYDYTITIPKRNHVNLFP